MAGADSLLVAPTHNAQVKSKKAHTFFNRCNLPPWIAKTVLMPGISRILSKIILCSLITLNPALLSSAPRKILVHGHRGARGVRPENTIPAFEYAIQSGVDALELDMAVTKDDVIVVSHDPVLRPPVCSGPQPSAVIHQLPLSAVLTWDCGAVQNPRFPKQQTVPGTRMPTLEDVFRLANRGSFLYNIETKSFPDHPELTPPPMEFARMVLDEIRKFHLERRVILQSFDFRTLTAMKALASEITLSALTERDPREFTAIAKEAQAGIISPEVKLVTPVKVSAAHEAGLQVVPWTADTPEEWDKLIAADVDAIITDYPGELISYLRERHLH